MRSQAETRRMGFSFSRGLFHPGLPVPASRRAHRDAGRWWQVGLRRGPRSKARQMRHLLLRYALLLFFFLYLFIASLPPFAFSPSMVHIFMLSWMCDRHQRRVLVRTRLVAARSRLRGVGI
jgi:hypothetical protein